MSTTTSASRAASAPSERRAQAARRVRLGDELGEPGLLADVRAALVDRRDDGRVDVDRDDGPAVRRELGGQRQAHLAGADDGDGAGRAGLAGPRRDTDARDAVAAGVASAGRSIRRASDGAVDRPDDRTHAGTSSTVRRSRAAGRGSASARMTAAAPSSASAMTTAQRPSSASTSAGRRPGRRRRTPRARRRAARRSRPAARRRRPRTSAR